MLHKEIFHLFKEYFSQYGKQTKEWFPNGKDSIRVRLFSGSDFVFTFHNDDDWCFETVDSHIRKMKGEI